MLPNSNNSSSLQRSAPEPTLRRLPTYRRFLVQLQRQGRGQVSCTHIADDLGLDPTQVRKDLAVTGIVGKPKVGYEVAMLIAAIDGFLGWDNATEAFLVGAGSLGTALMGYEGFREHGLNIIAAFDVDERKVGQKIRGKAIMALPKLPNLARRMHIHLGIIATPAEGAQHVADLMIEGGIRAIWNFAPVSLKVPEGVIVENVQLSSSLAVLSSKLMDTLRAEEGA
ncbi:MAG: redox-sensing transcriptional repressor Rex [Armatimonadota bacterium]